MLICIIGPPFLFFGWEDKSPYWAKVYTGRDISAKPFLSLFEQDLPITIKFESKTGLLVQLYFNRPSEPEICFSKTGNVNFTNNG
jgi:hypothetical protein